MTALKIYEEMKNNYNIIYDILVNEEIATEEEISLVGYINGFSVEMLTDILFVRTGYTDPGSFDHYELDDCYYNYLAAEMEG